jgi:hypothetical protein
MQYGRGTGKLSFGAIARPEGYKLRLIVLPVLVSKGPASNSPMIVTFFPFSSFGNRTDREQVKPHPYSKSPLRTVFPVSSTILKVGGGGLSPFFSILYLSPLPPVTFTRRTIVSPALGSACASRVR